jgi:hypothetical protein
MKKILFLAALALVASCKKDPAIVSNPEVLTSITAAKTLTDFRVGVDYVVNSPITIKAGLTIEPGVTVEFAAGAGMTILTDGFLAAEGTAAKPIDFLGKESTRGFWGGIRIQNNTVKNRLVYCQIDGAGQSVYTNSLDFYGGLDIYENSRAFLDHTTLQNCAGPGLCVRKDAWLDGGENCTFSGNKMPVFWMSNAQGELKSSSNYLGNDGDFVQVQHALNGSNFPINRSITWQKLGVPYRITEVKFEIDDNITFTINPGATIEMSAVGQIYLNGTNAKLVAEGNAIDKITFTGIEKTAGYWNSIRVDKGSISLNNCVVESGGAGSTNANYNALILNFGGSISVKNSTIRQSAAHGISVKTGLVYNSDAATSNVFSGISGQHLHIY